MNIYQQENSFFGYQMIGATNTLYKNGGIPSAGTGVLEAHVKIVEEPIYLTSLKTAVAAVAQSRPATEATKEAKESRDPEPPC